MSKRVEEIRRQHGETTGHDARSAYYVAGSCETCDLFLALAQAEREQEEAKDAALGNEGAYRAAAHENGELRAEVERLKASL